MRTIYSSSLNDVANILFTRLEFFGARNRAIESFCGFSIRIVIYSGEEFIIISTDLSVF